MKTPATYSGKVLGLSAREIGPEYICKNVPQPPAAGQAAHTDLAKAVAHFMATDSEAIRIGSGELWTRTSATNAACALLDSHASLVAALELDAASKLGADEALPMFRKHGYTGKPNGAEMSPWVREFKRAALAAAKQA